MQKGIFAAYSRLHSGKFGVAHGAEEREQAAGNPHRVDGACAADSSHHLAWNQKNSRPDDDAHDDGGGMRGGQDARELMRLLHGCSESSTRGWL